MIKNSKMIIRLFTQYNHIEKEGNYWLNSSNYYEIEKSNEKCYTAVLVRYTLLGKSYNHG